MKAQLSIEMFAGFAIAVALTLFSLAGLYRLIAYSDSAGALSGSALSASFNSVASMVAASRLIG